MRVEKYLGSALSWVAGLLDWRPREGFSGVGTMEGTLFSSACCFGSDDFLESTTGRGCWVGGLVNFPFGESFWGLD